MHVDRIAEIHKIWAERHCSFADLIPVQAKLAAGSGAAAAAGDAETAATAAALAGTPYDPAMPLLPPPPPAPPAPPVHAHVHVPSLSGAAQGQGEGVAQGLAQGQKQRQAGGVHAGQSVAAVAEAVWTHSLQIEDANRLFKNIARNHGLRHHSHGHSAGR
jgi:hypothetical protein